MSSVFASRTGSGALDLKERFYLLLRGQQEAHSCEGGVAEKKLFSSEQASDGREARRGSVCSSEHSWAVQAEAAPALLLPLCAGGKRKAVSKGISEVWPTRLSKTRHGACTRV